MPYTLDQITGGTFSYSYVLTNELGPALNSYVSAYIATYFGKLNDALVGNTGKNLGEIISDGINTALSGIISDDKHGNLLAYTGGNVGAVSDAILTYGEKLKTEVNNTYKGITYQGGFIGTEIDNVNNSLGDIDKTINTNVGNVNTTLGNVNTTLNTNLGNVKKAISDADTNLKTYLEKIAENVLKPSANYDSSSKYKNAMFVETAMRLYANGDFYHYSDAQVLRMAIAKARLFVSNM